MFGFLRGKRVEDRMQVDRIQRVGAELTALYNDAPWLHRVDPMTLVVIEDAGGTFDFETGTVAFCRDGVPVVGTINEDGRILWNGEG